MSMRGIIEFAAWIADDGNFKAFLTQPQEQLENFELTSTERHQVSELLGATNRHTFQASKSTETWEDEEETEFVGAQRAAPLLTAQEQQLRVSFVKQLDDYISSVMQAGDWILDDANFQSLLQNFPHSRETLIDVAQQWKEDWALDERVSKTIANVLLGDI